DTANYERLLARNEATLRDCAGVGVAQIARAYAGLKTAAERGDVLAQVWYATVGAAYHASTPDAADGFRRDALRFLETAASRGSVQALRALARAYDSGTLAAADAQKSYVYTYALYLLEPGPDAARHVDDAAGALSPEQVGAAQREAGRLLARCCR
ncbi:MAG TPA: hypothetical protein VJ724_13715, partial [Tahibacter sp.]|nr:hypothetical protein [Tahibacter sp.]